MDIAAEVRRIVVDTCSRADASATILPSPVVMDIANDRDCMSATEALHLEWPLCSRFFFRQHLQRWAAATSAQKDQSLDVHSDRHVTDAQLPTEFVLPVSLAQLRQRYNSAAKLSVSSEGQQTILEQVSVLCGTWNM